MRGLTLPCAEMTCRDGKIYLPKLVWPPHSLQGAWISTKGAADRPQAGMVTGGQVPGLNGTLGHQCGVCKNLGGHPRGEKGGSGH